MKHHTQLSKYELAGVPEELFTEEELQEIENFKKQTGFGIYDTMIELKHGIKFVTFR